MLSIVGSSARDKLIIVAFEFKSRFHLEIRKPPITIGIVQILIPILQENANVLLSAFADHRRVAITTTDIRIAADVTQYFVEILRMRPGRSECTDRSGGKSANAVHFRIIGDVVLLFYLRD